MQHCSAKNRILHTVLRLHNGIQSFSLPRFHPCGTVKFQFSSTYPDCLIRASLATKWKRTNTRLYSKESRVTLISDGKTEYFNDDAKYDDDGLLRKVVNSLKDDNGVDICVVKTSGERRKYADYVIIVSGRSSRHLKAMSNHIHTQTKNDYPRKLVIVTGLNSNDWMIVDCGSIIIHLFLPDVREKYELEKLWALGPQHDEQYQNMLNDDTYAELVKNAKLEEFFLNK